MSALAYAPDKRIAAVMLFSQKLSAGDEIDMRGMTQALIERALDVGGSYYLPYRLHATPRQIHRAYPELDRFIAGKRRYDPQLRFRNALWEAYFAQAG